MRNRLLVALLQLVCCLPALKAQKESPYLKEILLGRCYFEPPTKNVDACPSVVGSIMNLLESHLDADIKASDFDSYLQQADVGSPPDKALIYLRFFGAPSTFSPPAGFVTPETTAGGALFKDLMFCGVDQRGNCSIEKSDAYWTFWEAAYVKFALQVRGHLHMVVEPKADVQFLIRSAVSNLDSDAVSSVTIYGDCDSSQGIDMLVHFLHKKVRNVTCKRDMIELYVGNDEPTTDTDSSTGASTQKEREPKDDLEPPQKEQVQNGTGSASSSPEEDGGCGGGGAVLVFLLALVVFVYGVHYYCLSVDGSFSGKNNRSGTVRDFCTSLRRAILELWQWACNVARDCFGVDGSDQENVIATENSPLVDNQDYVIDEFGCRIPTRQAVAQ